MNGHIKTYLPNANFRRKVLRDKNLNQDPPNSKSDSKKNTNDESNLIVKERRKLPREKPAPAEDIAFPS